MRPVLLLGVALALLAGCRTTQTRGLSTEPAAAVRVGKHARTWEVRCDGDVVGFVVLFQDRGQAQDSVYVVRNPWQQDVGMIDGLGRAFRYVPHLEDAAWVGSGTIALGAERILGARATCELLESDGLDAGTTTRSPVPASAAGSPSRAATTDLPGSGLPQSPPADLSKD